MYGEIIKSIRNSAGLTQEQLADILNVSRSLITKYERNHTRPDLTIISQIMNACNSSIVTFAACMVLQDRIDELETKYVTDCLHSDCADYDAGPRKDLSETDNSLLSLLQSHKAFTGIDLKYIKDYLTWCHSDNPC